MFTLREPGPTNLASGKGRYLNLSRYAFKRAETPHELEQVLRLNYQTFVRELRQHADTGTGCLVDKYHHKNEYFVAMRGEQVVGMLAVHDQQPFSVADRLEDKTVLDRLGPRLLEVRLLAIAPNERHGLVFAGLMWSAYEHAWRNGYTHVIGSGVSERLPLYERLGFCALGPAVPCGDVAFVPMALALHELPEQIQRDIDRWNRRIGQVGGEHVTGQPVCLLPGPVHAAPDVVQAFREPAVSHRSREFADEFEQVRQSLSDMVGGLRVGLFVGSGTLANDVVAATLAADRDRQPGILLCNGEFGERLAEQAKRAGLEFRLLAWPWGQPWDLDEVAAALQVNCRTGWVWAVHLESSTGVLNDLPGLIELAHCRGVRVCVDCVSGLGAVPLDFRRVHLGTGVSGKALGAVAGVAIVFASPCALQNVEATRMPTYLDLPATLATRGPRFTFPSPELHALRRALERYVTPAARQARYTQYTTLGRYVRNQLRSLSIEPLASEECAAPTITTFPTPAGRSSPEFVERCRAWGFEVAGHSEYLSRRRWVQIATMGAVTQHDCARLFDRLHTYLPTRIG